MVSSARAWRHLGSLFTVALVRLRRPRIALPQPCTAVVDILGVLGDDTNFTPLEQVLALAAASPVERPPQSGGRKVHSLDET